MSFHMCRTSTGNTCDVIVVGLIVVDELFSKECWVISLLSMETASKLPVSIASTGSGWTSTL